MEIDGRRAPRRRDLERGHRRSAGPAPRCGPRTSNGDDLASTGTLSDGGPVAGDVERARSPPAARPAPSFALDAPDLERATSSSRASRSGRPAPPAATPSRARSGSGGPSITLRTSNNADRDQRRSERRPSAAARHDARPRPGAAIEARALRRVYKAKPSPVTALDGVDLEVPAGEMFGLLGPNGAGKTTLIKILTTLLLPTSGTARVAGFDVVDETARIRRVMNMVSGGEQSGYGILTVREQLWMFSQFYGLGHPRGLAADGRADRPGRPRRAAAAARQRPLDRPAPEAQPCPRLRQRPVDPLPRRADPRPRRGRGARRAGPLPQLAGGGAGADGAPHDPLHGRGRRALRPRRHRGPRPDPGPRHAGRAQAARPEGVALPDRGGPPSRRAGLPGAAARRPLGRAQRRGARRRLAGRRHS